MHVKCDHVWCGAARMRDCGPMAVGAHFISLYFFIYVAPAPHPGGGRARIGICAAKQKSKRKTCVTTLRDSVNPA